jgi:hypothetical protein
VIPTRDPRYLAWIEEYVSKQPSRFVRGKCDAATKEMVAAFPELRRACGFVYCAWGRDEHWWCVDPAGAIVDPTAEQFHLLSEYEELDLTKEEDVARIPTGKCMNCGGPCYGGRGSACSDECEAELIADMQSWSTE